MRRAGTIALVAALLGLLAASLWLAARTWISAADSPMPATGYIAMTLGIVFSLVVGCGLMALLFYSNRHGYDDISYGEPQHPEDEHD
jgi:hypothetical protein